MREAVFVTGGAGFIGGCFARRLITTSTRAVINIDKLSYASSLSSLASVINHPRHHFTRGDVRDTELVARLLAEHQPAIVAHFAAETHVDRSIDDPTPFIESNVLGTCSVLAAALSYWRGLPAAARERFRLLHVSTDEIYGEAPPGGKLAEHAAMAPNSPYAASKAAANGFVRAYHRTYGLPVLQTMCVNNYGPYQFPEKLIPLTILNAAEGRPIPVYGDGQQRRDWIHVDDHCRALEAVLQRGRPGETYHIGAEQPRANLDIVRRVCQAVDRRLGRGGSTSAERLIEHVADRPGHDREYGVDCTKLRAETGWRAEHDLDSGIEATVDWYLRHSEWVEEMNARYQRERLGRPRSVEGSEP